LGQRRRRALEKIDSHIEEVEREVKRADVLDDVSHRCLYPLQRLRGRIEKETSIGNIQLYLNESTDLADQAIDLLESTLREQREADQRERTDDQTGLENEVIRDKRTK